MSQSYAVLGATGNTGLCLLQVLLQNPSNRINAYCRSREKLLRLLPRIADEKAVNIYEGSLNDTDLLANCLRGTRAAFLAVAVTDNVPGNTIAQDTAAAVIPALEKVKAEGRASPLRRLVVLSAAPLEPKFTAEAPAFIEFLLTRACSNIYGDLAEAEKLLRAHEDLVKTVFVKPGALTKAPQTGHVVSFEEVRSPVSFMDLAAGMVEVGAAEDGGMYEMRNVSVNPTSKNVPFPRENIALLVKGLLYHYFPFLYGWI